ncbi:hypothetical protein [Cupriavidus pauculus]|uniref:hypothetical protein n=1 Tax=Cupriavidus pauculus TaxID=82633 RepID=UPI001EE15B93|nr:hypothetical protein [Cupriavidus pauculus]GJG97736.1 hypothetical protein CBA19C6_24625 [Cupriavidus pauculus]
MSVIAGFQVMGQIVELAALTQVDANQLAARLEAVFELLIMDGPRSAYLPPQNLARNPAINCTL